ncbi:hypothetical protein NEUTE2DRAFT_60706, partial [Neurospora tetrasperma FGSC 2509]
IVVKSQGTLDLREAFGGGHKTAVVLGVGNLLKLPSVDATCNNEPHAIGHLSNLIGLTWP